MTHSKSLGSQRRRLLFVAVVILFIGTGSLYLIRSRAASPFVSAEAEAGQISLPSVVAQDTLASGSAAIKFSPASTSATADFIFTPAQPIVNAPVTFSGSGPCDATVCRYTWRWYRPGGTDRLGTTIGEGAKVTYVFTSTGQKNVVLKITQPNSTNNFVISSKVLTVTENAL